MYAKLKFIAGTQNRIVNRGIAQIITKAYVSGYDGNLDGITDIDSAQSIVYSADSSHWNFVNGSTDILSTFANHDSSHYDVAQAYGGTEYILQNTTGQAGHVKTVGLRMWGNKTNSGVYGSGTGGGSFINPIHHFGVSGVEGYTTGNTTSTTAAEINHGAVNIYYEKNIHIFADRYKLCLIGKTGIDNGGYVMNGVFEFPRTSSMKYRDKQKTIADSNVPYYHILQGYGSAYTLINQYGGYVNSTVWTSNRWNASQSGAFGAYIQFPGGIYNERTGNKLRSTGFAIQAHSTGTYTGQACTTALDFYVHIDDDATQNITAQATTEELGSYYTINNSKSTNTGTHIPGYSQAEWGSPFSDLDPQYGDALQGGHAIDSNGQRTLTLDPIIMNWQPYQGDTVNMSELSGHYYASGNMGFFGDSATIGGDTYQYFPFSSNKALVLKRM